MECPVWVVRCGDPYGMAGMAGGMPGDMMGGMPGMVVCRGDPYGMAGMAGGNAW